MSLILHNETASNKLVTVYNFPVNSPLLLFIIKRSPVFVNLYYTFLWTPVCLRAGNGCSQNKNRNRMIPVLAYALYIHYIYAFYYGLTPSDCQLEAPITGSSCCV